MAKGKLEGKVALVTGGNSGIGLATARRFVEEGAFVFITGRRQEELDAAVREVGRNVAAVRGDVSNLADLDRLYATIKEKKGRLDVVFANAGGGEFLPLGQITEAHYDKWFGINVKGLLFTVQKALPLMTGGALGIGPYEGRRDEVFRDWRRSIENLAACPNVVVKLGGLAMPVNGFGWHKRSTLPSSTELAAAQAPYYEICIERFGPERCMFESNFPVDRVSCSYSVLWNAFKRVASGASLEEKAALFHDTAARVYRIEEARVAQ